MLVWSWLQLSLQQRDPLLPLSASEMAHLLSLACDLIQIGRSFYPGKQQSFLSWYCWWLVKTLGDSVRDDFSISLGEIESLFTLVNTRCSTHHEGCSLACLKLISSSVCSGQNPQVSKCILLVLWTEIVSVYYSRSVVDLTPYYILLVLPSPSVPQHIPQTPSVKE